MTARRNLTVTTLATLLAAVLVAACGSSSGSSSGGSSGSSRQAAVTDRVWVLDATRLLSGGTDVIVTAEFAAGRISGENGCNRYSGPYRADAAKGTMTIGPNLASSQMACPGVRAAVERAYMARLPKTARYEATADRLTLLDSSGAVLLRYTASNGAEEIKGAWKATSIYTGTAIASPVAGSSLTASFDGTQISGDSGCNSFSGGYTTDGKTIKIGPLASTQRACADPAVGEQEQQYLTALGLAETFTVAGSRLDLYRADGAYAASFTR